MHRNLGVVSLIAVDLHRQQIKKGKIFFALIYYPGPGLHHGGGGAVRALLSLVQAARAAPGLLHLLLLHLLLLLLRLLDQGGEVQRLYWRDGAKTRQGEAWQGMSPADEKTCKNSSFWGSFGFSGIWLSLF